MCTVEKGATSLSEDRSTKRGDMDFPLTNGRALALSYLGVWCGVVWSSVVYCGVVWCSVVRCDVLWCGVVWCGVV